MSLILITGCMYAGKTESLLSYASKYKAIGKKIFTINYELDKRYSNDKIVSHNGKEIDALFLKKLSELKQHENLDIDSYDVFLVNEGQFFDDLYDFCLEMVDKKNKIVVVCGLDSDYERKPFESIMKVWAIADKKISLTAYCKKCGEKGIIKEAIFSKRICKSVERILIGSGESYIPVCRHHYIN